MSEAQLQLMTVEQAKQVRWLRTNPKPLGELLDEGYLDRNRLEWAATKAYSPMLRQAAHVLLQAQPHQAAPAPKAAPPSQQNALKLRLSLADARSTPWPFQPFAGQSMGELIDTQQLTLKDLGYAVERARNARVREAAMTLMSARLEQALDEPSPLMESVKVVSSGKSFAIRRTYAYTLLLGLLYGTLFTLLGVAVIWNLGSLDQFNPSAAVDQMNANPILIIGVVIFIGILLGGLKLFDVAFEACVKWTEKKIKQHERGAEGEERALEVIERTLDGQWTLFRNVMIPGQSGDIDMILVGPTGLWALEIKNWNGAYRYQGDHWLYLKKGRWSSLRQKQKPSEQARRNAARLGQFLKADGIQKWVTPALIWASTDSSIEVENPATAIWRLERLSDELANVWQGTLMRDEVREQVIAKLTQLCEVERKRQQEMWEQ